MAAILAELEADPRVVWTDDILRYGDTDANGHINNTTFSVLCESGRVDLFTRHFTPVLPAGILFVIVRLVVEFKAELHYPGRVRTATWVGKIGRTSITVEQTIVSEGRVAGTGEGVCVLLDAATRRAVPIPDGVRAAAEAILRSP